MVQAKADDSERSISAVTRMWMAAKGGDGTGVCELQNSFMTFLVKEAEEWAGQ
jgi:hypothetical protein